MYFVFCRLHSIRHVRLKSATSVSTTSIHCKPYAILENAPPVLCHAIPFNVLVQIRTQVSLGLMRWPAKALQGNQRTHKLCRRCGQRNAFPRPVHYQATRGRTRYKSNSMCANSFVKNKLTIQWQIIQSLVVYCPLNTENNCQQPPTKVSS